MVEGIPGSRETTTAGAFGGMPVGKGLAVKLHLEGDSANPSDFAWVSVIPPREYEALLRAFPAWGLLMARFGAPCEGRVALPYMRMKAEACCEVSAEEFMRELMGYHNWESSAIVGYPRRLCSQLAPLGYRTKTRSARKPDRQHHNI